MKRIHFCTKTVIKKSEKKIAQLYFLLNEFIKSLSLWGFSENKCFEGYYYNTTHAYIWGY
jgi:hypothetical protein